MIKIVTQSTKKAAFYLQREKVVAIPTETVYGLAGSIYSDKALRTIFELKNRPYYNPLIVHIDGVSSLERVAVNIPQKVYDLAAQFWPGPLTFILEKHPSVSDYITAGRSTVAVRMPNHPLTLELLQKVGAPLAAPSANPFGSISPTTAQHVFSYFKKDLEVILDGGPCEFGIESTIVGFENNELVVYRLGSITLEALESVVGKVSLKTYAEDHPKAPGMLSKHYAPQTPLVLTSQIESLAQQLLGQNVGLILFQKRDLKLPYSIEVLSEKGSFEEAAKHLYDTLHRMDQKGFDLLLIEPFPDEGLGRALNDRLKRASVTETHYTSKNVFCV